MTICFRIRLHDGEAISITLGDKDQGPKGELRKYLLENVRWIALPGQEAERANLSSPGCDYVFLAEAEDIPSSVCTNIVFLLRRAHSDWYIGSHMSDLLRELLLGAPYPDSPPSPIMAAPSPPEQTPVPATVSPTRRPRQIIAE